MTSSRYFLAGVPAPVLNCMKGWRAFPLLMTLAWGSHVFVMRGKYLGEGTLGVLA